MDKIEHIAMNRLIPYARNARTHSDTQVAQIAASIREFGFCNPVLIDDHDGIIAGHGRVLAGRKLGLTEIPCIRLSHLTETQRRAYIIADNKLALNAEWDTELLALEMEDLQGLEFDLELTGFDMEELAGLKLEEGESSAASDETYSRKIEAPIYEPTGPCPAIHELYEEDKYRALVQAIDAAELPKEVADFLRVAATRHTVFKFRQIAEFYAHSSADIQRLMEQSGLVIIDFNKAIEYGFVHLTERLGQIADIEGWNNDEG